MHILSRVYATCSIQNWNHSFWVESFHFLAALKWCVSETWHSWVDENIQKHLPIVNSVCNTFNFGFKERCNCFDNYPDVGEPLVLKMQCFAFGMQDTNKSVDWFHWRLQRCSNLGRKHYIKMEHHSFPIAFDCSGTEFQCKQKNSAFIQMKDQKHEHHWKLNVICPIHFWNFQRNFLSPSRHCIWLELQKSLITFKWSLFSQN